LVAQQTLHKFPISGVKWFQDAFQTGNIESDRVRSAKEALKVIDLLASVARLIGHIRLSLLAHLATLLVFGPQSGQRQPVALDSIARPAEQ